jgi:hypothetical protein
MIVKVDVGADSYRDTGRKPGGGGHVHLPARPARRSGAHRGTT